MPKISTRIPKIHQSAAAVRAHFTRAGGEKIDEWCVSTASGAAAARSGTKARQRTRQQLNATADDQNHCRALIKCLSSMSNCAPLLWHDVNEHWRHNSSRRRSLNSVAFMPHCKANCVTEVRAALKFESLLGIEPWCKQEKMYVILNNIPLKSLRSSWAWPSVTIKTMVWDNGFYGSCNDVFKIMFSLTVSRPST